MLEIQKKIDNMIKYTKTDDYILLKLKIVFEELHPKTTWTKK